MTDEVGVVNNMLYLHDVWVNWFEGDGNGYSVCYYHEWRKSDKIELLDQVPLLYINRELYDYIENDMKFLPKQLLNHIYQRTYMRKGPSRIPLDYASIVSDGTGIIVFDTAGYDFPIRKSRLIPRQEQMVYDLLKKQKKLPYKVPMNHYKKEYDMISMPPEYIFGLTRRERKLKQILMIALDQLKSTNNIDELRYWLTEWNPKKYPYIRYMDSEEVWSALFESIKQGWDFSHEEFTKKLIRGNAFLENMWELEYHIEQDKSFL